MCAHAALIVPPTPALHPATPRLAPHVAPPQQQQQQQQQRAQSVASDTSSSESETSSSEEELTSSSPCFVPYNKRAYWFFRNCRTVGVQTRAVCGRGRRLAAGAGAGSLRARTVTGERVLIEPHDDAVENATALPPANLPLCIYEFRNVVACTVTNMASQLYSRLLSGAECCFLQLRKQLKYPVKSKPTCKDRKKAQYTQFDFNSERAHVEADGGGVLRGEDGGGDGMDHQSPTTRPHTLISPVPGAPTARSPISDEPTARFPNPRSPLASSPVPGATTTNSPVLGAPVARSPVSGAPVAILPVPDATTTSSPVPGATTINSSVPGATTINSSVPGATTTSSPVPGAPVASSPVPGATITSSTVPGAPVASSPVPGATRTSSPAPGALVASSPVPGATRTSSPAPGAPVASSPVPGATITSSPVPGVTTINLPVPGATITSSPVPPVASPPVPGTNITSSPVPGAIITSSPVPPVASPPVPGTNITSSPVPGAIITSSPVPPAASSPVPGATSTSSPDPGAPVASSPVPGATITSSPVPGAPNTSSPVFNSLSLPQTPCLCNTGNVTDTCKEYYKKINVVVNAKHKAPLKKSATGLTPFYKYPRVLKKKVRKSLWARCFKCFRKDVLPCSCVRHLNECLECKNKQCNCSKNKCKSCFNNSDPFLDPNFIKLLDDETNYHDALRSRNIFIRTDKRKAFKALPTRCGWRAEERVKAPCTLCNPEPEQTRLPANRTTAPGITCEPYDFTSALSPLVKSIKQCICKAPIETKAKISTYDELRPCEWISNTKDGKICSICQKNVCKCQCKVIKRNKYFKRTSSVKNTKTAKPTKSQEKTGKLQKRENYLSKESKARTKPAAVAKQSSRIQAENKRTADVKQGSEINAENKSIKPIAFAKQGLDIQEDKKHTADFKQGSEINAGKNSIAGHKQVLDIFKDQNDTTTKDRDETIERYTNTTDVKKKKENKSNDKIRLNETKTKKKEQSEESTKSNADGKKYENDIKTKPFDGTKAKENNVESKSKQKLLSDPNANEKDISKDENDIKTKPFDGTKAKENNVESKSKQKLLSDANANEQDISKEKHRHGNTNVGIKEKSVDDKITTNTPYLTETKTENNKDTVNITKSQSRNTVTKEYIHKLVTKECSNSNTTGSNSTRNITNGSSNTTKCSHCNCESENSIIGKKQSECVIKLIAIKEDLCSKSLKPDFQNITSKVDRKISTIKDGHLTVSGLRIRKYLSGIYIKNYNIDTKSITKCQSGNISIEKCLNKSETEEYSNGNITKGSTNTIIYNDYNYSINDINQPECLSEKKENLNIKITSKTPQTTTKVDSKTNKIEFLSEKNKNDMSCLGKGEILNSAVSDDSTSKVNIIIHDYSTANVKDECVRKEVSQKIVFNIDSKKREFTTNKTKTDLKRSNENFDDNYNMSIKKCQSGNNTTKKCFKAQNEKCPRSFTINNISKGNINSSEFLSAIKGNFTGTRTGTDLQGNATDTYSKGSTDKLQNKTNVKENCVKHKSSTQSFSSSHDDEMKDDLNAVSIPQSLSKTYTYEETKNHVNTKNDSCCTRNPLSSTNTEIQDYGCAQKEEVKLGNTEAKKNVDKEVVNNRVNGIKSMPINRKTYSRSLDKFIQVLTKTAAKRDFTVNLNEENILGDEFLRRVHNIKQERDANHYVQTQTDQIDQDFERIQILMTLTQSDKYTQIEIKAPESNKIQKSRHLVDKSIRICPLNYEKCTFTDTPLRKLQSFNCKCDKINIENTVRNKRFLSYKVTATSVQTKKKENFSKSTFCQITPNVSRKSSLISKKVLNRTFNYGQYRSGCCVKRPKAYSKTKSKATAKETSAKHESLCTRKQASKCKVASKQSSDDTATAGTAFFRKARNPYRTRTKVKQASNQTSVQYVPKCCRTITKAAPKPTPEIIEVISSCCQSRYKRNENNASCNRQTIKQKKDIHIVEMKDIAHPLKLDKYDYEVADQLNNKTLISNEKINSNYTSAGTITSIKSTQSKSIRTASLEGNHVQMFCLKSSLTKLFNNKGRTQACLIKDKGAVALSSSSREEMKSFVAAAVRLQPGRHVLLRHFD